MKFKELKKQNKELQDKLNLAKKRRLYQGTSDKGRETKAIRNKKRTVRA